jgi:regulator of protease activity HflC (stomatin/prohibitin superfamily)
MVIVMKTIVNEGYRGLLFKDGCLERLLAPGAHRYPRRRHHLMTLPAKGAICAEVNGQESGRKQMFEQLGRNYPFAEEVFAHTGVARKANADGDDKGGDAKLPKLSVNTLLAKAEVAANIVVVDVADGTLALHFVNERFQDVLRPGRYAFWNVAEKHAIQTVQTDDPMAAGELPAWLFDAIDPSLFEEHCVKSWEKARLFYDGRFIRLLDEGIYRFWNNGVRVVVETVDTRLLQMDIQGQELLSADKVTLRINFVLRYRISDYVQVATKVKDYAEQLRVQAQLALREFVGQHRLDAILDGKEELAGFVLARLKAHEQDYFVDVADTNVKDIILPGEIRDIMNTVLVAEKRAQANVIARREEVASTRSLMNMAKLMEENAMLMRLKEMEYLERLFEKVDTITVHGGSDLLGQLGTMIGASK